MTYQWQTIEYVPSGLGRDVDYVVDEGDPNADPPIPPTTEMRHVYYHHKYKPVPMSRSDMVAAGLSSRPLIVTGDGSKWGEHYNYSDSTPVTKAWPPLNAERAVKNVLGDATSMKWDREKGLLYRDGRRAVSAKTAMDVLRTLQLV